MKKLLILLLILISVLTINAQIVTNFGFKPVTNNPFNVWDTTAKKANLTLRTFGLYEGQLTFVQDIDSFYVYNGTTWKNLKNFISITETDPIFLSSPAYSISLLDKTKLNNLSGINTGDQDLSGLATKTALSDTSVAIRTTINNLATKTALSDTSVAIRTTINNLATTDKSLAVGTNNILRVPTAGQNLNATSIDDWINWWYYSPAKINLNISPDLIVEIGTTTNIVLSGETINPSNDVLSNGILTCNQNVGTILSFNSNETYSINIDFTPLQSFSSNFDMPAGYYLNSYTFVASQEYNGKESGTTISTDKTITAVYPVFYGVSIIDLSNASGSLIYYNLNKSITLESSKSLPLEGMGYAYIAIPKTWSDYNLSSIIDHNGFNVMDGFSKYDVTITSVELDNNYTDVQYVIYKSNFISTYSDYNYTFNR